VVKLKNNGETRVKKEDVLVRLKGIQPQQFGKNDDQFMLHPEDDLESRTTLDDGSIIDSTPVFVEFKELNHITKIQGNVVNLPLLAEVCYLYQTKAVTKLCVRKDLLNPADGGLCEVSPKGEVPVQNSGSLVHVQNVRQAPQGKDKLRLSFDLVHIGDGNLFEKGSICEGERKENKVYVKVDTGIPGLRCTGLNDLSGTSAGGTVTLYDDKKTISCTQTLEDLGDYEKPVNIFVDYDYSNTAKAEINVKHVGE
ncbi:hypothetical protein HY837_06070, partial [archaeon]|nr:hypothetical protein [archaeon]